MLVGPFPHILVYIRLILCLRIAYLLFIYTLINDEVNPELLHLKFIESKEEQVHLQFCGMKVDCCLGWRFSLLSYLTWHQKAGSLTHTFSRKDKQPPRFCLSANSMWMSRNDPQSRNRQVTARPKSLYDWVPLLTVYDFLFIPSLLCKLCSSYWYSTATSTWFSSLSSKLPISHFGVTYLLTDSLSLTSVTTI